MNVATSKEFINESFERLHDANVLLDAGSAKGAISNSYYAVFNAIAAVFVLEHDELPSKHEQLLGQFNKKYIYQQEDFDVKVSKIANSLYSMRISADYLNKRKVPLSEEQAIKAITDAQYVLNHIKIFLDEKCN